VSSVGRTEQRDVDARTIVFGGAALAAFILLVVVVIALIYGVPPRPLLVGSETDLLGRNVPVLQTDPHADLKAYATEKDRALHSYGWVDEKAGIAHVPIEEAMRTIARSGIPDWGQTAPPTGGDCALLAERVPRAPQAEQCLQTAGEKR